MSGIMLTDEPVRRPRPLGSPLLRKIQRACRLSLPEPDLGLNLDVADYINDKQGAAPREAALTIVRLINSKDIHTAIFALSLLDVLVKNCGYPIHLQISRKEFLNELVRSFPERPLPRPTKVQKLILTAIEEWYQTICKHSAYKEDMGYIRDMHRLLKYKGYSFPHIKEEDLAVLRPSEHLKTSSEIQKEQEIAQAAKLEELIRRGRPEDLKEANKLMKVMAGFKEDNAIQAKQSISDELSKLKRKADLFNEMLTSNPDLNDDALVELYSALKVSQPKFQKIIEEEQDDDQLVQDLLGFNDTVNQLLEKYNLLKTGHSSEANQITVSHISSSIKTNEGTGGALANELNLIDFDDETPHSEATDNAPTHNINGGNDIDDLLGDLGNLNFNQPAQDFGLGGSISLTGPSPVSPIVSTPSVTAPTNTSSAFDLLSDISSTVPQSNNKPATTTNNSNSLDLLGGFDSPSSNNNLSRPATTTPRLLVHESTHLKIEFALTRQSPNSIEIHSYFSNIGPSPIAEFTFLIAVPKTVQLRLNPQSGSFLPAETADAVSQLGFIDNVTTNMAKPLKVKWKCDYTVNGTNVEETAVTVLPSI
ncbi:related to ADP-ribosylation factor-binding protein GGA2 [Saccharomycodes ludwigii]|uniref:Related to ADP-ribosylation factor-binding protein GGA2 n=1 Tax=Saccharomycodes ludwigii TaxID=36035 RepID=A0A376B784_9ASCO|nr:hypothetical protein SCDLUD_003196 [Saccharomycodes ludwigii]KAH3900225.1 hypothetical protein SCDLUD_003196 [Saccharomycodes ludwigii]SSD60557.1 related to ADP-ribosylation factor-binding protein GGA2 [Saccharomycodes ludwigii]